MEVQLRTNAYPGTLHLQMRWMLESAWQECLRQQWPHLLLFALKVSNPPYCAQQHAVYSHKGVGLRLQTVMMKAKLKIIFKLTVRFT